MEDDAQPFVRKCTKFELHTYAYCSQIGHQSKQQSSCVKKSRASQPSESWRGSGSTFFTQILLHFGRFEKLSIYLVNLRGRAQDQALFTIPSPRTTPLKV